MHSGPLICSYVIQNLSWEFGFWFVSIPLGLTVIMVFLFVPEVRSVSFMRLLSTDKNTPDNIRSSRRNTSVQEARERTKQRRKGEVRRLWGRGRRGCRASQLAASLAAQLSFAAEDLAWDVHRREYLQDIPETVSVPTIPCGTSKSTRSRRQDLHADVLHRPGNSSSHMVCRPFG